MRTSLVGDGCSVCNPEYYLDILTDQLEEIRNEEIIANGQVHMAMEDQMGDIITTQDAIIDCQAQLLARRSR